MIPEKKIRAFWQWFQENEKRIAPMVDVGDFDRLVDSVGEAVKQMHPKLDWEVGPGKKKPYQLAISAKSDRKLLRTETDRIVALAPDSPEWEFYPALPPKEPPPSFRIMVKGEWVTVSIDEWRACATPNPEDGRVDLVIVNAQLAELPEMSAMHAAFIMLDALLGEDAVEARVGEVSVAAEVEEDTIPMLEFRAYLEKLRN